MNRDITHLLSWVQRIFVLPLRPVSYNDAIGYSKRALFPSSLSSCKVADVGYILPLCICDDGKPTLQICKLLLQFRSFCTMLRQFSLFQRLTAGASPRVHCSVDLLINLIRFLVISLVSGACKQAVLVIRILELVRIDVWFFSTPGLSLAASMS